MRFELRTRVGCLCDGWASPCAVRILRRGHSGLERRERGDFDAVHLGFHPAPILLGFVLGSRFEENFRRAMLISRGDLMTFIDRPISAAFLALSVLLIALQIYVRLRPRKAPLIPAAVSNAAEAPQPHRAPAPYGSVSSG